ncbi:hypothetical protein C6A37_06030 [Desulfobacteraceae bacterium SEEP-SAG9]|nr:hypothetical protein C6A37_06030 [Desulfobacteraceae bacterium SEEP-SAG9]
MDIIKEKIKSDSYRFTIHAIERCVERIIAPREIEQAILTGEIIENYPEDKYGATCLIFGTTARGRILHVQASIEPVWIITAYDPAVEADKWENDFKRRRKK